MSVSLVTVIENSARMIARADLVSSFSKNAAVETCHNTALPGFPTVVFP